jgi:hypothetical protein
MASRIQDFNDTKFKAVNNNSTIQYNSTDNNFKNDSVDQFLEVIELPEDFVEFIANNIDLNNFTNNSIDGGLF